MSKTLYALLVGIDQYRPPVGSLNGCVNDVEAVADLLQELDAGGEFTLDLSTLKNSEATRSAVIDGFRNHMRRSGPEDVALFYYCGHGSQEKAPPEFWHLEPDRLNETLVCYDSRENGKWDLADKELATLIAEVAKTGAHVVCILDCCHSGSGTRAGDEEGIASRRAPTDRRDRPVASFLGAAAMGPNLRDDSSPTRAWNIGPNGRHILLSACRSNETAKEVMEAGRPRGAFSAALLAALRQTRGAITYRDLLKRVEAQVRLRVAQQVPQLEATNADDLMRPFLGGAARQGRSYFTLRYDRILGWVIDGGAVHGIPKRIGSETVVLAIFELHATAGEMRTIDGALATAEVEEVRPELSLVTLRKRARDLDRTMAYRAAVVATPLPAIGVYLSGAGDEIDQVRRALSVAGDNGGPSLLLREVNTEGQATLTLEATGGSYRVGRARAGRALIAEIDSGGGEGARSSVECLEHAARWHAVADLGNPDSRLNAASVEVAVLRPATDAVGRETWRQVEAGHDIRLEYVNSDGRWRRPRFRIELRNSGPDDLYCALLLLGEDFSISSSLLPGGTEYIPADRAVAAYGGNDMYGFIPDSKWRTGRTENKDILKLVVSTEQFDPRLFDQAPIDQHIRNRTTRESGRSLRNSLERIAARVHHREIGADPEEDETRSDWAARELLLTVVRPFDTTAIPPRGMWDG